MTADGLAHRRAHLACSLFPRTAARRRPPAGARCEKRIVTHEVSFLVQHYDLPSLFAGKLHAALQRTYTKGRDWYDVMWYLSRRPPVAPNILLLENALAQTAGGRAVQAARWKSLLRARLAVFDFAAVATDVQPFLEDPRDAALLTRENLLGCLDAEK
jgi:hypothetical protein